MPTLGEVVDPSQYTIAGEVDPRTLQLIQPGGTNQPGGSGYNAPKYASDTADIALQWARQHGATPTQENYFELQKSLLEKANQFQNESVLQKQRELSDLQKQMTLKTYEQAVPLRMTEGMLDKSTGLTTATDTIMNLNALASDARKAPGYGAVGVSGVTTPVEKMTDPRVRLYEAEKEGAIINLGRGVLEDTGQVAGKDEAQALVRNLMPNQNDNEQMANSKTAALLQKVLIGLDGRIRQYKNAGYMTGPLEDAYNHTYANYLPLVNQYGSDAQKMHPAASPDELFGTGQPHQQYMALGQAKSLLPAPTQVGFSDSTNAALNAANTPGYLVGRVPQLPSDDVWQKAAQMNAQAAQEQQKQFESQITPESSTVADRFQQSPDMLSQAIQGIPSAAGQFINWLGIGQPMQVKPGVTSNLPATPSGQPVAAPNVTPQSNTAQVGSILNLLDPNNPNR